MSSRTFDLLHNKIVRRSLRKDSKLRIFKGHGLKSECMFMQTFDLIDGKTRDTERERQRQRMMSNSWNSHMAYRMEMHKQTVLRGLVVTLGEVTT